MTHILFKSKMRAIVILSVSFLYFLFPQITSAQVNFGGRVLTYMPICETPPGVFLTIGLPTPMALMYLPGALSYSYGPPAPGRNILGKAGLGWIPCMIWVPCGFTMCPIVIGGGFPILFHGSSMM